MFILSALLSLQVHAADTAKKGDSKPLELPKPVAGYPAAQGSVSVKKCTPLNAVDRATRLANQNARDAKAELESPITDCAPGEVPSGTAVEYKPAK